MRMNLLAGMSVMLGMAAISMTSPAQAWDPKYPVCMRVYDNIADFTDECYFTNMAQCQMSASGRPAQCLDNPFYEGPRPVAPASRHKRRRHHD